MKRKPTMRKKGKDRDHESARNDDVKVEDVEHVVADPKDNGIQAERDHRNGRKPPHRADRALPCVKREPSVGLVVQPRHENDGNGIFERPVAAWP